MLSFDLQSFNSKAVGLTFSQDDKVTNPLCTVFQRHKDESTEFFKPNKRQYGIGLMTFADLIFVFFGAVQIDDMLEQQKMDSFP